MPDPSPRRRDRTSDQGLARPRLAEPEKAPTSRFPVSVIMERRRVSNNRWLSERWNAVGVTVDHDQAHVDGNPTPIIEGPDGAQYLWRGLTVALFIDEAESYYHNLMVGTPGCYVVTRERADGMPEPVIVSLSFDAGQAYSEGDEIVHNVALPAELYRAAEAFVLAHYLPEKKKKRKRTDWKGQNHAGH